MDTEALKKSLLTKFVEVTADRLQVIQLSVLELEKPNPEKAYEDLARELHTMKGESRMLGLQVFGQLAHASEDVLQSHQAGTVALKPFVESMLLTCDLFQELLEDLEIAKSGSPASEQLLQSLYTLSGKQPPPPKAKGKKASGSKKESAPPASPPKENTSVGPAVPPANEEPPEPKPNHKNPPASEKAEAPKAESKPDGSNERQKAQDRSIRVSVEVLDDLGLLAGDLLVESERARLRGHELNLLLDRFARWGDQSVRFFQSLSGSSAALPTTQIERLEGDLHLLRDDAFRFMRGHIDAADALHGTLAQLADDVAEARLVPLSSLFDAFPRAARDIANSEGKQVDLVIEQTRVGVDRSMVNDVRDAMIHLLRNAVDHGLETPSYREALGKAPAGRIIIRVKSDGDMLVVEIEDDGRGIDAQHLRSVAVDRQILTQAQAAALNDREAIDLIFRPGFSTRTQISEVSGRGVGMDVVKRKVEVLGGAVAITSRVGLGTTVRLRLPQSLALMRVLLVRLGDDVYGMPAADVEAVARFRPEERLEILGSLAVMHRERPTTLVSLGPLLGLNGGPRHDRPPAVVVRHGDDRVALCVDGVLDEREVAVKSCGGEFLKGAAFIAGTAALEDGRIAVLLHVPDLMAEVRRRVRPVTETSDVKRLRVLLVDDSPIARATQSALVKALGHAVTEATDGEEAWSRLHRESFDLILTDVQMPKLDGFNLTRRIKTHGEYSKVPVIILSSLASPEDRRRGVDAGADAYLIKGELGVETLALAIDRLI